MGIQRKPGVRAGKLFTMMPSGGDPTDFISTMDDLGLRLADKGEKILDDTYADLLLKFFPKEFAFIRQVHHRDRSFTLEQIKQTAINFHIDELSRKSSAPTVAGRGAVMAAASRSDQCHQCKAFGHCERNCPGLRRRTVPRGSRRRVGKAEAAILHTSGVPATKRLTATPSAMRKRSLSNWLRIWRIWGQLNKRA